MPKKDPVARAYDRRVDNLKRNYLWTPSIYEHVLMMQGGCCAICGRTDSGNKRFEYFVVDHDHETGDTRGLLCHPCNVLLGHAKDSVHLLNKASEYLVEHARDDGSRNESDDQ